MPDGWVVEDEGSLESVGMAGDRACPIEMQKYTKRLIYFEHNLEEPNNEV